MDPFTIGALTIATTAAGVAKAQQQNQAVRRSMKSASAAEAAQQDQINQQEQIELLKRRNEAEMIRGRLRVTSAEAGVGDGAALLFNQAAYDEALGNKIIGINAQNERRRVATGLQANLASIAAQSENALLAGLFGGLQGLQTGLTINSLGRELSLASGTTTPTTIMPDPRYPLS